MEIPKKCELPFADIVLKDADWPVSSKLINIIGDEEVVLSDPSSFMML